MEPQRISAAHPVHGIAIHADDRLVVAAADQKGRRLSTSRSRQTACAWLCEPSVATPRQARVQARRTESEIRAPRPWRG